MTRNENIRRAEEIADSALDYDAGPDRETYIANACGNDADLATLVMEYVRGAEGLVIAPVIKPKPALPSEGRRIGAWKLLRRLGEGGFGVVYLAERTDGQVRQLGAIKFLKGAVQSRDVELRFLDERQILANLNHPYIVGLIDAGVSEEQPYLVMEVVEEALPIDEFCKRRQYSVKECLLLFRKVCDAVAYAHRKLVVHRDLKPGNILVTNDGTPRLLDFGVAKILDPMHRGAGQAPRSTEILIGTERYWSPEQARRQPVDTGTDVYSLGVILYELLAGTDPYELERRVRASVAEIICTVDPEPPSEAVARSTAESVAGVDPAPRRQKSLKGDVDAILMKALRKEREQRYRGVEEFSDDIQRHLDNVPVRAHLNTFTYRLGRFVRRNRDRVIAGTLVFFALLGGLIATIYQRRLAIRNEHIAVARELASYANQFLATDPQRALQLSMYAVEATFDRGEPAVPVAETALHQAVWRTHASKTLNVPGYGAMALSPDGKRLATIQGSEVQVLDVDSGRRLVNLDRHGGSLSAASFSADGKSIAACSESDGTAKVWYSTTGRELASFETGLERSCDVAFSPDGRLVSVVQRGTVQIWDVFAAKRIFTIGVKNGSMERLEAPTSESADDVQVLVTWDSSQITRSEHSRRIFVDVPNGTAEEWDIDKGERILQLDPFAGGSTVTFDPYDQDGFRVFFSPDGTSLAAIQNNHITIWRNMKDEPPARGAPSKDRVWTARTGQQFVEKSHFDAERSIKSGDFSGDGKKFVVGCMGQARAWDVEDGTLLLALPGYEAAFSADGRRLATSHDDRTVKVWDLVRQQEVALFVGGEDANQTVAFSPDGKRVAMIARGKATLWDASSGRELAIIEAKDLLSTVSFSTDGKRVATGSWGGPARIWDVSSGRELLTLGSSSQDDSSEATFCTFSPDGRFVITIGLNGTAKIWDASTARQLLTLEENKGESFPFAGAAFSPDSKRVVTAIGGTAIVWDTTTGRELRTLSGENQVMTLAFSPDGKRIATGSKDSIAKIWDASSGRELVTLQGNKYWVYTVAFSPDGRTLATGSGNGVKLFDVAKGDELLQLSDDHEVTSVAFSPDGKRIVAMRGSLEAAVYTLDTRELLDLAKKRLTTPLPLTGAECRKYIHAACPGP